VTIERWRQIEGIYQAAADLHAREQRAFLDRACGSDCDLRTAIDRLLSTDGNFDVAVEAAIRDEAEDLASKASELIVGTRIGPYRVTAAIGTGGMGAIYRAERDDDEYQKEVAIKVVKRGMDLDAVVRRFRKERQILACLEHPNIARLIDGGVTGDGQPYFVMEYVEGRPFTDDCAALPIEDRLQLFRQVCAAVQYAHENHIIHRDIKPANILVTKHGVPKLLDFGLANVLTAEELPEQTYTFLRMLTPDYASPEQVRGEVITSGTDIYSLGAILYELVSGSRAHQFNDRTTAEIERVICEEDPPRIPGELGSIVQMAMHKQPEHRYATAEQLSDDVRRYLEHVPVLARKGAVLYATRKFVGRNKLQLAATVIALISIAIAITATFWHAGGAAALRVRPITALPGVEGWPDLSPDGKNVVFTWMREGHSNASLYIMPVGGGSAPVRLTDGETVAYDWSPAWSPDGRQIAFRRQRSVYLVSALGGAMRKLADDPQASSHLSWSPDGKWIGTAKYPAAYSNPLVVSEMALISTETGERKVLSRRDPPAFDDAPVFCADGRKLAYMACKNGSNCTVVVQNINPQSGFIGEPLPLPAPGEMHSRLAWSPDHRWIVYSRFGPGDVQGLWRVSANGGTPAERLALPGERFTFPTFARTSNRLVVAQEHLDVDILQIPLDRAFPPLSTVAPARWAWSTRFERRPDFSPDGRQVVFSSDRAGASDLWLANADGSNPAQLTNRFGSAEGSPKWSPDGRLIAFTSLKDGNADVWVMGAEGGGHRRLTHWPTMEAEPSWSRDGTAIYFRSDRTGTDEIWRLRLDGGDPQQMTTQGGYIASESADGTVLYYTKQNSSPLFVRPVRGGVEKQILDWVDQRCFVVTRDGIYYVVRDRDKNISRLWFYEYRNGRKWFIRAINATPSMALAVSPDRRTILLPVFDPPDGNPSSDPMLIENFE
jgi:Tol biopolymer transport system component/tRNA A-37 threonylcarbamoyl transferase component Bud32